MVVVVVLGWSLFNSVRWGGHVFVVVDVVLVVMVLVWGHYCIGRGGGGRCLRENRRY